MKKKKGLEGFLDNMPENQIYLNIDSLKDGTYELKIVYKNKVIKKTTFKKQKWC